MPEKKFCITSGSPIQEIGMRAQIISFLIANGIKEGNAVNDMEDARKVIIAVRLDDEDRIRQLRDKLVVHLNKLKQNDLCYSQFPDDISATELTELNNPHPIQILALNDVASGLMLEQTSKGVGAMRLLVETLNPLKELPNAISELAKKLR